MINYYRILQLDDYSEVSVVKRQYRKLAKLYHPDVNTDNPEAEEIIKIINKAHSTLTNPKEKVAYDDMLRGAYFLDQFKQAGTQVDEAAIRRERAREFIKQKLREELREFETGLRKFPAIYRYGLGILAALTGLQMVFSNWYVNLTEQGYTLVALGYLLFLMSCGYIFQFYDRHLWYRSQIATGKLPFNKVSPMAIFLIILVMGPAGTWLLSEYRKNYHLDHYQAIAVGRVIYITSENRVRYQFESESGKRVIKSQILWNANSRLTKNEWIYVAYSRMDPGISKIILSGEHP